MHDAFISYASPDKPIADAACAVLEQRGIRCWMAPRDVTPGLEWGAEIVRAIKESAVMVLVYSRNANASSQVKREVERAVSRGIAVVPFRIEDVPASETLEFFISTPHWLDALTPPMERHLQYLAETVDLLRSRVRQGEIKTPAMPSPRLASTPPGPVPIASPSGSATSTAKPLEPGMRVAPGVSAPARSSVVSSLWKRRPSSSPAAATPNERGTAEPAARPWLSWRRRMQLGTGAFAVAVLGYLWFQYSRGGELREWAGTWTTDNVYQGVPAHWTLVIDWSRNYRSNVETRDEGAIRFTTNGSFDNATYEMETAAGRRIRGSFRLQGPHTALISGPFGNATWSRSPSSATSGATDAVGEWAASRLVGGAQWAMVFRITANGRYELVSRAEDEGRFATGVERNQKRWYLHSTRGTSQDGIYERIDGRTVSMRGPSGTAVWVRK